MFKQLLPFFPNKNEPVEEEHLPWPDGAMTVKIRVLRSVVVHSKDKNQGPWVKLLPGVYSLQYEMGTYVVTGTKRHLAEAHWKARMETGSVVVIG